jgi:mono/diheme cytochrome c family protein
MRWRGPVRRRVFVVLIALGFVVGALGSRIKSAEQTAPAPHAPAGPAKQIAKRPGAVAVTPVEGPSTLHHLRLSIETSSMGWEGQWSPPPAMAPPAPPDRPVRVPDPTAGLVLTGADLYRVSCRACHKADGSGGPPEINSLIGPVQSASARWMTERMKAMGRPVDPAFIRQLTSSTEADLRKRLKSGGHNMPSFAHLSDAEITVLRPYLDEMARVPGAEREQRNITEPAARVGELIVKGTCHICHDATGPDSRPTTVLSDVIPSLASIPRQKTLGQFAQKIRQGTPIPLSAGGVMSKGRMPVFAYLTEAEVASAYSYLITYPPR